MKDNQSVWPHGSTSVDPLPTWLVYHELSLRRGKAKMMTLTEVKPEWLIDAAPTYYDPNRFPDCYAKQVLQGIIAERNKRE